ncbi:hypothetical protein Dshi_0047 [Dinoroseobacter shibae DFL 12 = DSM 16493]|jgi:hypothetical protein|uniref:Phage-Barnase-EndoU-ColicinE5/D-RelE like nuclease 3 domain-containing protein n=1 Tax=Dinoroseobacter shibae (strain DSM 16493 / NCIMB 14021 / DFL 12) TaxID=398580 RepID=A8LJX0_DINSH|nr:hypothetical protein Dshi_0047 [Dinoroseobacter shibae DFL 12 = DSM 16493]
MKAQTIIEVYDEDLVELFASRRPELEVGTLPFEVRKYLGCSRDTIFLSDQSARHIIQAHGDHITNTQLKLLPKILCEGLWLSDNRATHAVVSCNVYEVDYKTVIKVTEDRTRTYVKTLHRTSDRQKRALLRKTNVLRNRW